MGLLEGYYVPLYKFHYNPVGHDEKVQFFSIISRKKIEYIFEKILVNF